MRSTRLGENADLAAAAAMPLAAVLLPKVESPDRMRLTVSLLDSLGAPACILHFETDRPTTQEELLARIKTL